MFAFELCRQSAQFLGVLHDGTRVGVLRRPLPRVFTEAMQVIARLAGEFVLDAPDFLKNWIRFHKSSLP